jgi:hypothetical protein
MSSKTKSKKSSTTHYYGCVYGGIMKQGYVCFFSTTEDPEEYFLQFKDWYGSKVRGRFVKASDEEDYLEKLEEKLEDHNVHGKIYEVSVDTASKTLKELTGAKKTSLLGEDESHHDEDKGAKSEVEHDEDEKKATKVKASKSKKDEEQPEEKTTTKKEDKKSDKKVVASKSSKKAKAVESEDESDAEPSEAESEAESEPEEKPAPKVSAKKEKKETKAKSSK